MQCPTCLCLTLDDGRCARCDRAPSTIFSDSWRAPSVPEGETVLFDEPGRITSFGKLGHRIDCSSHYFRVTQRGECGQLVLRVKHGAGEERINLGYSYTRVGEVLTQLDSDARYAMLYALYRTHGDATRAATEATEHTYRAAFAEGRLKKRKLRGQDRVRVWIEPKVASAA